MGPGFSPARWVRAPNVRARRCRAREFPSVEHLFSVQSQETILKNGILETDKKMLENELAGLSLKLNLKNLQYKSLEEEKSMSKPSGQSIPEEIKEEIKIESIESIGMPNLPSSNRPKLTTEKRSATGGDFFQVLRKKPKIQNSSS